VVNVCVLSAASVARAVSPCWKEKHPANARPGRIDRSRELSETGDRDPLHDRTLARVRAGLRARVSSAVASFVRRGRDEHTSRWSRRDQASDTRRRSRAPRAGPDARARSSSSSRRAGAAVEREVERRSASPAERTHAVQRGLSRRFCPVLTSRSPPTWSTPAASTFGRWESRSAVDAFRSSGCGLCRCDTPTVLDAG
jgi:hypothetical protein